VKKQRSPGKIPDFSGSLGLSLRKALAAIDRTVIAGLEGDLAGLSALGADSVIHLTLATTFAAVVLPGVAALLAALRLVLETTLSVEFLFTGGKDELFAAVFAHECFVFVHNSETSILVLYPSVLRLS
jgi:hypothetical protein